MITVVGKLQDVLPYVGQQLFNVLPDTPDWTPDKNREFIDSAVERGDALLFVSWKVTGQYRQELIQLLERLLSE